MKDKKTKEIKCKCGSTDFKVYITVIVDDADFICSKCGRDYWED